MNTVLRGTGRTGDAVHAGQEMSSDVGFANVAKIWYNQTKSFAQGFELLAEQAKQSEDILTTVKDMVPCVTQNGNFAFKHLRSDRYFRPTDYAIVQVGSWAECGSWLVSQLLNPAGPQNAKGTPKYLRDRLDAETLVRIIENGFRRIDPEKVFLFRVDNKEKYLRAMLSDQYACVNNEWFLQAMQKLVPGGRLSHWDKCDPETIWGNILIPDTIRQEEDSEYGGMLSVGNSQIGERELLSQPSVFRAICMNGCIWDQTKGNAVKRRHRGNINLDELFAMIEKNLQQQIPLLTSGIDKLLATKVLSWDGASMQPLFAQVAMNFKFSKKQASGVLKAFGEEDVPNQRSLFGVINAITRAGQKFEKQSEWHRADMVAGDLVNYTSDDWSRLTNRAKSLKVKEVEDCFAGV